MIANSWHGVKTPTKPTFDLCLYLPLYHPSANLLSKLWHWLFKYPYWRTTTPPVYNSRNVILVTCIAFVEMKYESTFVFILFVLCRNLGSTIWRRCGKGFQCWYVHFFHSSIDCGSKSKMIFQWTWYCLAYGNTF